MTCVVRVAYRRREALDTGTDTLARGVTTIEGYKVGAGVGPARSILIEDW